MNLRRKVRKWYVTIITTRDTGENLIFNQTFYFAHDNCKSTSDNRLEKKKRTRIKIK
jgi:hypothetical protein